MQQLIGLLAVGESLGLRVPLQPRPRCERDVRQMGERRRAMPLFDVGVRPFAALDAVEKIAGGLLIEVAVARLDDLFLPLRLRVLERTPALRNDLVAVTGSVESADRSLQLDLGAGGRASADRWPRDG